MKISVYIIAFNESDKIKDCINSVLWADEIIVADSHSTDGTTEIAQELGAKVIHIPFTGYGELRNNAISYCKGEYDHLAEKPIDIPANVVRKYEEKGWKGFKDFLWSAKHRKERRKFMNYENLK